MSRKAGNWRKSGSLSVASLADSDCGGRSSKFALGAGSHLCEGEQLAGDRLLSEHGHLSNREERSRQRGLVGSLHCRGAPRTVVQHVSREGLPCNLQQEVSPAHVMECAYSKEGSLWRKGCIRSVLDRTVLLCGWLLTGLAIRVRGWPEGGHA